MQRSAVDRIGDFIGLVWYSVFLVYVGYWGTAYTYAVFFLHQTPHVLDMVLFWGFCLYVGYAWGVHLGRLIKYHTFPWFFYNLGVYVPLVFDHLWEKLAYRFWDGLSLALIWLMKHVLVVTSWATSRAWPGRGIVFGMEFEDERDFKSMVHTAQEDHLPYTFRKDGKVIHPDEYDVSLSQHDLLEGTYPPIATLGVVDANPATHRDD